MASRGKMGAPQYASSTSMPRESPIRVNPNYPLQQSVVPSQSSPGALFPNEGTPRDDGETTRNSSRRRKVSGQGYTRNSQQPDLLPAAPDVPKAPPVSYRDPYGSSDIRPPTSDSSRSFAARARVIPQNADPSFTNPPPLDVESIVREKRHSRRGSISHNPGPINPGVQQPLQESTLTSRVDPLTPEQSPKAANFRQNKTGDRPPPLQGTVISRSRQPSDTTTPPVRSQARKVSVGVGEEGADWAANRSPLQKLEGRLNEYSKEEKRARVQEAERRLRENKSSVAHRRGSSLGELAVNRARSKYEPAPGIDTDGKGSLDHANQEGFVRDPSQTIDYKPSRQVSTDSRGQNQSDHFRKTSEPTRYQQPADGISGLALDQAIPHDKVDSPRKRSADVDLSRGVRFHDQSQADRLSDTMAESPVIADTNNTRTRNPNFGDTEPDMNVQRNDTRKSQQHQRQRKEYTVGDRSSREVPEQQKQLYSSRIEPTPENDTAAAFGGAPDPVQGHAVRGYGHGVKYDIPPQTAGGINARQQIGFGSRQGAITDGPKHHDHHVSGSLHHDHHDGKVAPALTNGPPRHLSEWRQGSVARLTLADFTVDGGSSNTSKAWWEREQKGVRHRSSASNRIKQETVSLDGGYEDNSGMIKSHFLLRDRLFNAIENSRRDPVAVRARQYIGYYGTSRVRRRNRSWLRQPGSLLNLRLPKDFQPVSHSSPLLPANQSSNLSLYNLLHILKPSISQKLTRRTRSVRELVPAAATSFSPPLYLKCGPLLRYTGLRRDKIENARSRAGSPLTERETWRGSVLIVTVDSDSSYTPAPTLRLFHQPMDLLPPPPPQLDGESSDSVQFEYVDPIAGLPKLSRTGKTVYVKPAEDLEGGVDVSRIETDDGLYEETRTANVPTSYGKADELLGRGMPPSSGKTKTTQRTGKQAGRYREVKGVRLHAERGVTFWRFNLEVELGDKEARIAYSINKAASVGIWVPARGQTMNVMFHSCNGFSLSVDPANFTGPDPLWRDVLNAHQTRPFHVMLGGGDQIYNDAVMKQTSLFRDWLKIKNPLRKHEAEFSLQMRDELEAFYLERYSMWFSQGLFGMANAQIPMVNMWDDHDIIDGFGSYPHHFMSTPVFCGLGSVAFKYYMLFQHQSVVDETQADEPSWLLGAAPGPYINELSRSVFMFLGKHVAFLGLDCRTERMREEILSEASYKAIFDRCRREIVQGVTKHLIVLLGVPIAYPRLVWLENILTSRVMDPIKAMGRAGMLGNFLNQFDGGVEILDDLDDHWTAKNHKHERNWFVQELQDLAAEKSVRVTILGGDVHLAAIGQFYSNPKLKIPKDQDHRYMPNIISSAIVNTPPPEMMGDILNKRNKVHHLDHDTDEDMIPMFTHDVDGKRRNNKRLLPRRNWCSIHEYNPGATPTPTPPESIAEIPDQSPPPRPRNRLQRSLSLSKSDSKPSSLFRRLSHRAAPSPPDYPSSNNSPVPHVSADGYFPAQPKDDIAMSSVNGNNSGNAAMRVSSAPLPIRPISDFHRRPTNLSEMAAKKAGTEQIVGHVNLEGGLDVVLNCEVSQRHPAGSTVPYRLLVPALWYKGESEGSSMGSKPKKESWLRRLGSRHGTSLATRQRRGNWGGESETESESGSERDYKEADSGFASTFRRLSQSQRQSQSQSQSQSQGHRQVVNQSQGGEYDGSSSSRQPEVTPPSNARQSTDFQNPVRTQLPMDPGRGFVTAQALARRESVDQGSRQPSIDQGRSVAQDMANVPRQSVDRGEAFARESSTARRQSTDQRRVVAIDTKIHQDQSQLTGPRQQQIQGQEQPIKMGPTSQGDPIYGGKLAGKFDANGNSDFFGKASRIEIQGNGDTRPRRMSDGGRDVRPARGGVGDGGSSKNVGRIHRSGSVGGVGGYSGIEAYKDRDRNTFWKRFLAG